MRPGSSASAVCLTIFVFILSGCVSSSGSSQRSLGQITMDCVNKVMNSNVGLPDIVILKRSQFASLFGAQYDGYYVGREQRVYLSSSGDGSLLAHELAHHVQISSGRYINEAEAEHVAMRCANTRRWRG